MSQAKVDRYKESKKHRKEEVKKAKRQKALTKVILCAVAVVIVCWIGFSGYRLFKDNQPIKKTEVSLDAINDYMISLTSHEEEE